MYVLHLRYQRISSYNLIIIIIIIILKSRNYRKQPYWTLHTYFGKY